MKTRISLFCLLMTFGTLLSVNAQANCDGCTNNNLNSSTIGDHSVATGTSSFAAGHYSRAEWPYSFAIGARTLTQSSHAMALGLDVNATARMAVAIGEGVWPSRFTNSVPSSLMVGFNTDIPTLFVGKASGLGTVGKVGIGTSTPGGLLEVTDDSNPNLLLSGPSSKLEVGVATTSGSFSSLAAPNDIVFKSQNSRRMIFTTNAGLASPAREFIFANTNGAISKLTDAGSFKLYDGDGANDYMEFDVKWDGNFYWNFNSPSSSPVQRLHIGYVSGYAGNAQPDRILDAVIIGTSDAASQGQTTDVMVHGEIRSCGVKTQEVTVEDLGWCDYVFEEDYPLMPLKELAQFIDQNQHLPNIPSAAEVATNGRELGDMQKRMMEKIEELTLYVIQLEQEVDSLREERNK